MNVDTSVSGSHCVVEVKPGCNGIYIDARRGHCVNDFGLSEPNGFTRIEVVVAGHVRHRESTLDAQAPERLCQLMRQYGQP